MPRLVIALLVVTAFLAGAAGSYLLVRRDAGPPAAPAAERAVLYWYDPMQPQQHFDRPGKSPFMDMALVPKYADGAGESADDGSVRIDPRVVQNLGVRTAVAERGVLSRALIASATLAWDERATHVVTARAAAVVDALFVRAPLAPLRRGQPLARLIVPEWTAAAAEYATLRDAKAPGLDELRRAARQRLALLGVGEAEIAALDRGAAAPTTFVVTAPQDGVLGELPVRVGASVAAGMPIAEIRASSPLWALAAIPENAVAGIAPDAEITLEPAGFPGQTFRGRWLALLPAVDPATRSRTARIEVDNPDGHLAAGMFARVRLTATTGVERVLVPSEALIVSGTRSVLLVAGSDGRFEPRTVTIGAESEGRSEILTGLAAGERVVRSGQFLIDSEASLRASIDRLSADGATSPPEQAP